jgi:hypothetical protein
LSPSTSAGTPPKCWNADAIPSSHSPWRSWRNAFTKIRRE